MPSHHDGPDRHPDEPEDPTTRSPYSPHGTPAPLSAAAGLTFVQGVLALLYGIGEVASLSSGRLTMGLTTAAFLVGAGVALLLCAWGLHAVRPWARGPVLLAQLLLLGLAWNFRSGSTLVVAVLLAVTAAVVLAGLLHPRSIDALERADHRG
ncbi:MAG: hypothetical protein JWR20_1140 [Marmoricola sp.]|nr:hypothetical protein [Marmoricola sp.]MCW2866952.1 hypothetical protein [Marmoricola sp.]